MGSHANQPDKNFVNPLSLQKDFFKNPSPEMNLVNYSNQVDYDLVVNSQKQLVPPTVVFVQPTSWEGETQNKSFLGENETIVIGMIVVAIVMLGMYFANNNQYSQTQKFNLAQQERQDKLAQQEREYQLAQQGLQNQYVQQYQQYQLAWQGLNNQTAQQNQQYQIAQQGLQNQSNQQNQQYQIAQQGQQNQVAQQDQQFQLAQQGQQLDREKLNRQYALMKQAQAASTSTTTNVRLGMDFR